MVKHIVKYLNGLPFVNWDRYFEYDSGASYFGWIDREDKKKDFVVVDLFKDGTIGYATSSKRYTEEIAKTLGCTHSECKRIENIDGVSSSIKLKDGDTFREVATYRKPGITIIGVKVVGICSKCRREGDEIMRNKDNSIIPDEELSCPGCALGGSTKVANDSFDDIIRALVFKCKNDGYMGKSTSVMIGDIGYCVSFSFREIGVPIDKVSQKPVGKRTEEEHLRLIKDKFNGRVRDYLLSMGAFKK